VTAAVPTAGATPAADRRPRPRAGAPGAAKGKADPLFTEADVEAALAFAESDVAAADAAYFEAEEAFATAERQKRIDEGRRAEAAERALAAAERDRRAGSDRNQRTAESSRAAAAVAGGAAAGRPGLARSGGVPAAGDGSGPRAPRRSGGVGVVSRPVKKRSDAPARRRAIAILGAAALAVPAFALGATQPWKSVQTDPDRLGVVGSDRGDRAATESEAPASAVRTTGGTGKNARNPHPAPSIGVAPGPAVAGVLSVPGGSVLPRISALPSVAPSAHRNDGSVPGLDLTVQADDVRPHTGTAVHFTLAYTDGTGYYAGTRADWGDGSPKSDSVAAKPCTGDAPPAKGSVPASHTFTRAGMYTVTLSATTYTCDGRSETQTVPMTITVTDAAPDPTPSGSPSPVPTAIAPSP
jgi:surface-anchored protein